MYRLVTWYTDKIMAQRRLDVAEARARVSESELKKQYRLLALRYHPDSASKHGLEPPEAEAKFQALQQAYEVLNDPLKRLQYDRELRLQQQPCTSCHADDL